MTSFTSSRATTLDPSHRYLPQLTNSSSTSPLLLDLLTSLDAPSMPSQIFHSKPPFTIVSSSNSTMSNRPLKRARTANFQQPQSYLSTCLRCLSPLPSADAPGVTAKQQTVSICVTCASRRSPPPLAVDLRRRPCSSPPPLKSLPRRALDGHVKGRRPIHQNIVIASPQESGPQNPAFSSQALSLPELDLLPLDNRPPLLDDTAVLPSTTVSSSRSASYGSNSNQFLSSSAPAVQTTVTTMERPSALHARYDDHNRDTLVQSNPSLGNLPYFNTPSQFVPVECAQSDVTSESVADTMPWNGDCYSQAVSSCYQTGCNSRLGCDDGRNSLVCEGNDDVGDLADDCLFVRDPSSPQPLDGDYDVSASDVPIAAAIDEILMRDVVMDSTTCDYNCDVSLSLLDGFLEAF